MTTRRSFFKQLAISVVAISAPQIFIPKLIETPKWKLNPAWDEAAYSIMAIEQFNRLPYYIASMQIVRNPEWLLWQNLLEGKSWEHNMGSNIHAI